MNKYKEMQEIVEGIQEEGAPQIKVDKALKKAIDEAKVALGRLEMKLKDKGFDRRGDHRKVRDMMLKVSGLRA